MFDDSHVNQYVLLEIMINDYLKNSHDLILF